MPPRPAPRWNGRMDHAPDPERTLADDEALAAYRTRFGIALDRLPALPVPPVLPVSSG